MYNSNFSLVDDLAILYINVMHVASVNQFPSLHPNAKVEDEVAFLQH